MTRMNWLGWACAAALACAPAIAGAHGDEHEAKTLSDTARGVGQSGRTEKAEKSPQMTAAEEAKARQYFTDHELVDQYGEPLRFFSDVLRGRKVLINFIFTNCDVACPATTAKLNQVRKALGERFGEEFFFISVSIDPENDDPEDLAEFARAHQAKVPGWLFLTGEPAVVQEVVGRLGQDTGDARRHSTALIAGDVASRHWVKIPPYASAPEIVMKLQGLGGGNPLRSGG